MTRWLTMLAAVAMVAGCMPPPPPPPPPAAVTSQPSAEYLKKTAVKSETPEAPTAVESALAWSEKYSQAMEKMSGLQQESAQLSEKNVTLAAENKRLQGELVQAQKELSEANTMLVDIRQELEKWKANVLGFRQEMRSAQQAQLEALGRVLKLLGGEMPSATTQPASPTTKEATSEPTP